MFGLNTPILFLVFNRPEETAQVFARIRSQRPKQLFVAADGPRPDVDQEAATVQQTREIATKVDWPCEVTTLFRQDNLGCGRAVSEAITWFFGQVEEGIILEDDCLPHDDFFPYCETLLERHRHDPRVATIAGTHFLPPSIVLQSSHYASKYFQMWGWASWRRTWQHYDFNLEKPTREELDLLLQRTHPIPFEAGYWREVFLAMRSRTFDTWDFQVFFSCWAAGGIHLMPARNLVSNIGHGPNATHTTHGSHMSRLPTQPLVLGPEPISLQPDPVIDNFIFYLRFLDSFAHTWWVEQVLFPEKKLGEVRAQIIAKERLIRQMDYELKTKRRQLLAATQALANATATAAGSPSHQP